MILGGGRKLENPEETRTDRALCTDSNLSAGLKRVSLKREAAAQATAPSFCPPASFTRPKYHHMRLFCTHPGPSLLQMQLNRVLA